MSQQVKNKIVGKAKKTAEKVIHGAFMKTNIPAGLASSAPPLGTMLGQRGINIANFVKDFNERTKNIIDGIPLPVRVQVQPDRSYILEILKPQVSFLLKQAAGIKRSSMEPGHKMGGVISLKHVYEIAKFKQEDINCSHFSLEEMCVKVIASAYRSGIKVVKEDLDPTELDEFLQARTKAQENELKDIAEKRAAKLMRAANLAAAANAANAAAKK